MGPNQGGSKGGGHWGHGPTSFWRLGPSQFLICPPKVEKIVTAFFLACSEQGFVFPQYFFKSSIDKGPYK